MPQKLKVLFACSLATAVAGCAFGDAYRLATGNRNTVAQLAQSGTEIPIRQTGDYIVLRARVNGTTDANFLLDTGSPVIVLFDTPATAALGIDYRKARRLPGRADNTSVPTGVVGAGFELDFGPLKLPGQTLIAVPIASMQCPPEHFLKAGIDGIIGRDIFRRYVVEIDFDRNLLRLHDPSTFQYRGSGTVLPIADMSGAKPVVAANWNSGHMSAAIPVRMQLDTGFNGGLQLYRSTSPAIQIPADVRQSGITCGIGGTMPRLVGPPTSVQLAGVTVAEIPTSYNKDAQPAWNGLIGMQLLRRFNLVVDYPRNRLILEPRSTALAEASKAS